MKKVLFLLTVLLVTVFAFAQDSTGTGSSDGGGLPSWAYTVGAIILGIYELLARFIPTIKNYSILGLIISLIQKIIPNNSKAGEKLP